MSQLMMMGAGTHVTAGAVDAYAANGFSPDVVADFPNEYYRTGGTATDFDTMFSSPTRSSLATMYNSSGELVYCPHNLALNSASPATQNITTVSGEDYTVYCTGSGSITLSGAGTGTVSAGSPVTITASTTTLTCTVSGGPSTMWVNREPGDGTYVVTSGSIVYLPRRSAYTYNGTSWVNSGILIETEARTQTTTTSDTTAISWVSAGATSGTSAEVALGTLNAEEITASSGAGLHDIRTNFSVGAIGTHTLSIFAKKGTVNYLHMKWSGTGPAITGDYIIDLVSVAVHEEVTASDHGVLLEEVGDWVRCSIIDDTTSASGNPEIFFGPHDGSSGASYSAAGTETVHIAHLQTEVGDTPSMPIISNGATVARTADPTLTIPAAKMSYSSTAMSVAFEGKLNTGNTTASNYGLWDWRASGSERWLGYVLDNDGEIRVEQEYLGVNERVQATAKLTSYTLLQDVNVANRLITTKANVAKDGTAETEKTISFAALPSVSAYSFNIGNNYNSTFRFNGPIKLFRQWNDDIGDTGIESATS